ncbi:MAG: DUF2961 domain-containing protein [Phycisphaerae bacterium]|nr:DUF2961 domain-containing protein [Phycisphaerae bacterium]
MFHFLLLAAAVSAPSDPPAVNLDSLLREMTDPAALARFPSPAYTCAQSSSYDRASTKPGVVDQEGLDTWFANGDYNQFLRVEETEGRREWVLLDAAGPGAVVRLWSANPPRDAILRFYLDGAGTPAWQGSFQSLTSGAGPIAKPLSEECSRGWNMYLPIPYASRCRITSDRDGFYYQVNYRTYASGTRVESFSIEALSAASGTLANVQRSLADFRPQTEPLAAPADVPPGGSTSFDIDASKASQAITELTVRIGARDNERALRSTVLVADVDGEQTIWCPLGDFFGCGVGLNPFQDWYRSVSPDGVLTARFVMPVRSSARLSLLNLGAESVRAGLHVKTRPWAWDDRSMHFHARWRSTYPLHAYGGRGTEDWNYVAVKGRGVYVGDSLAVMNPVPEWWGEGDEKIYVDGETFPSHFGTGTEDYYGYAWCWPVRFQHPFHAQTRVDGDGRNNWGHTTVTRVRSLDAIPFTSSLRFDMELWHWRECEVAYAATTYFYAAPGASHNRPPQPESAALPPPQPRPQPPVFRIPGAIECEDMEIAGMSAGAVLQSQDLGSFGPKGWSNARQLWVKPTADGQWVDLIIPTGPSPDPIEVTLHATKSWDYGIVQFSIDGRPAGQPVDLYSGARGKAVPSGPISLGTFSPMNGRLVLRTEVVGGNPASEGSRTFFGLDCVTLSAARPEK